MLRKQGCSKQGMLYEFSGGNQVDGLPPAPHPKSPFPNPNPRSHSQCQSQSPVPSPQAKSPVQSPTPIPSSQSSPQTVPIHDQSKCPTLVPVPGTPRLLPQAAQDPTAPSSRSFLRLRAFPLTFLRFVLELKELRLDQIKTVTGFSSTKLQPDPSRRAKNKKKSEPKRSEKCPKNLFWSDLGASGWP